jgi:hypothetical protein
MELDPEIKAMNDVLQALEGLEENTRTRVLTWAISKYQLDNIMSVMASSDKTGEGKGLDERSSGASSDRSGNVNLVSDFSDIGEFYSQIDPTTDSEKVLTIGVYYQLNKGFDELNSADLNKELKHLGYRVSNVTVSISLLMKKKPALMIQTRKGGNSKQSRKKYKVTQAGIKYIEQLLNNSQEE